VNHRFVIAVQDVPTHEGSWIFAIPQDWGHAVFEKCDVAALEEPGELEVRVSRTGEGFLVEGLVRLTVAATCVRCLQPVPIEIAAPVAVLYVPGVVADRPATTERGKDKSDQDENDEPEADDGPDVEHFQNHQLVLDSYIRDTILLEVPMNPRCAVECRLPERPSGAS
jgi:uncharacterized metal-binding protein YceD (DUF177 family)